jgi:hypothetical protein
LHKATGDAGYLKDAEAFYDRSRTTEKFTNPNPDRLSYENVIPALHLMLYQVGLLASHGGHLVVFASRS